MRKGDNAVVLSQVGAADREGLATEVPGDISTLPRTLPAYTAVKSAVGASVLNTRTKSPTRPLAEAEPALRPSLRSREKLRHTESRGAHRPQMPIDH